MKNKKVLRVLIILIVIIVTAIVIGISINNKISKNNETGYEIVSKYNTVTKDYQDVKVRISSIVRGNSANKILDEYNKSAEYEIKMNAKEDEELIVVDYEIDFMNFDMDKVGTNKDVQANICQDENNNYILYNDKVYTSSVRYMNGVDFTTSKNAKGRFIATIPKGLKEYKIKMGIENQKKFYFDGI